MKPIGVLDASVVVRGKIVTNTPASAAAVHKAHAAALAAGHGQDLDGTLSRRQLLSVGACTAGTGGPQLLL